MPERLSIYVADGLRHRNLSGYGMLARNLILGLLDLGHEVRVQPGDREWQPIEAGSRHRLEAVPTATDGRFADVVLQICTPPGVRAYPKPTLVYTQNALGGLPPAWVAALSTADGIIVPGVFDQKIFSQYFDRVYIASQSSDPAIFKPYPGWRSEGSASFTFLFVGSYSFRKGVDLLLEAFLAEFEPDEPVELLLQVPGAGRGDEFNHCLRILQRVNPYGHLRLNGAHLAPEWMNRLYNRSDCVVTLSRGEGWCMPLTEALLSETPVIAPNSTAMGEYLDASVADMVSTRELPASDAPTPFGTPFADVYGFPGVTYYEPDIDEARSAMRRVFQDHASAVKKARIGRQRVLSEYSWAHSARQVASACHALLEPRITTSR